jgi:hypothetical protein
MNECYVLDGHTPVRCTDPTSWCEWVDQRGDSHVVAQTWIGRSLVSTVFLGIDHRFQSYDLPLLFETLVIGGPMAETCERYTTWDEAEAGHARMVERVQRHAEECEP